MNGVIAIGGDDTLGQAAAIQHAQFLNIVGVPKTIDNDVHGTDMTFGFQSACDEAAKHISGMRTDAKSMKRIAGVEIMGRETGWITLHGGYIGRADITLIPEFPIPIERLCERIKEIYDEQEFCVLAIAEGYADVLEASGISSSGNEKREFDPFGNTLKNGAAETLMQEIKKRTGINIQVQILGYGVRNGSPNATDAIFASQLGAYAGWLAHKKEYGTMVGIKKGIITSSPLHEAKGGRKVTEDHYNVETMRKWDLPSNVIKEIRESSEVTE